MQETAKALRIKHKTIFNKPLITHAIDKVLKNFKYICISTEIRKFKILRKKRIDIFFTRSLKLTMPTIPKEDVWKDAPLKI